VVKICTRISKTPCIIWDVLQLLQNLLHVVHRDETVCSGGYDDDRRSGDSFGEAPGWRSRRADWQRGLGLRGLRSHLHRTFRHGFQRHAVVCPHRVDLEALRFFFLSVESFLIVPVVDGGLGGGSDGGLSRCDDGGLLRGPLSPLLACLDAVQHRQNVFGKSLQKTEIDSQHITMEMILTLPLDCRIVVLVLHCLSRLIISLVKSTSKSRIARMSYSCPISSFPFIVVLFLANRFALIAAIFSTDIASDKDLKIVD
jgi:hypothetical protein